MTRDEALDRLRSLPSDWYEHGNVALVDALDALELIKLETTEALVLTAAVERLTSMHVDVFGVQPGGRLTSTAAKLTRDGALEVLDILTKSGFRITRDEK